MSCSLHVRTRGNWAESEYPSWKRRYRLFSWLSWSNVGAFVLLRSQAFQRGDTRRNQWRDDEARLKSVEEKPSVPAGGPWVPASEVYCTLHAAIELSSSNSVLGHLLQLVRNKKVCFPWSFFAPCSEDLAWISNQEDPTQFFMISHTEHTCGWESWWTSSHTRVSVHFSLKHTHTKKKKKKEQKLSAASVLTIAIVEPWTWWEAGQRKAQCYGRHTKLTAVLWKKLNWCLTLSQPTWTWNFNY